MWMCGTGTPVILTRLIDCESMRHIEFFLFELFVDETGLKLTIVFCSVGTTVGTIL